MGKLSLYKRLGIPDAFSVALALGTLGVALAPWISGVDFGVLMVPRFPSEMISTLRWFGPILFFIAMAAFYPFGGNGVEDSQDLRSLPKIGLDEYKQAHIDRYEQLISGRNLIDVKLKNSTGDVQPARDALQQWIDRPGNNNLLLLGEPGSGKTFLLRGLASELANNSEFLPVFLTMGQLKDLEPNSADELLRLCDPPLMTGIVENKIVVFVDGVDELVKPDSPGREYLRSLRAVSRNLPKDAKIILSARTQAYQHLGTTLKTTFLFSKAQTDSTDEAINFALEGSTEAGPEKMELLDVPIEEGLSYLEHLTRMPLDSQNSAKQVLEDFPCTPVILRMLEKALPSISKGGGKVTLDKLYRAALRAWIFRELRDKKATESLWERLTTQRKSVTQLFSPPHEAGFLEAAGLVMRGRQGMLIWSHLSIAEYFEAHRLCNEICEFDATWLSRHNLIYSYNINRFLVPMLQAKLRSSTTPQSNRVILKNEYKQFILATNWRQGTGYGYHGVFTGVDGTEYSQRESGLMLESDAFPDDQGGQEPVTGLSWYDAAAFCLWSGMGLPNSTDKAELEEREGTWFWCGDWFNEREAHVAVVSVKGRVSRTSGINPDVRNSALGLVTTTSIS